MVGCETSSLAIRVDYVLKVSVYMVLMIKNVSGNKCFMAVLHRVSSVGIATRYGLDGPWIESLWGRDFPHRSSPALRPTHPPAHWVTGLSRGKQPGRGVDHPPPSSAKVEETVELYICSSSGPSSSVLGWTLSLPLLQYFWCGEQEHSFLGVKMFAAFN